MDRIAASSKEYVKIPVATTTEGVTLETLPVEVALVVSGADPEEDDWQTAAWDEGQARVLVGPGGAITLAPRRTYTAWVRVTGDTEVPVIRAGEIGTY